MSEIKSEIEFLWQAISSAQDESEKLKDRFMSMLEKNAELNRKIEDAQKKLEENLKEKQIMIQKIKELQEEIEKGKNIVSYALEFSEKFTKLKNENSELLKEKEISKNKEKLTYIQLKALEKEIKDQKELLAQKEEIINKLNFKIKALMDSQAIKAFFSSDGENKLDLLAMIKKYEENEKKLKDEIEKLSQIESEIKENNKKLAIEKEELEKKYKEILTNADITAKKLEESLKENTLLANQIEELRNIKDKLNEELNKLKKEIGELNIENEKKSKEIMDYKAEIADLRNKLQASFLKTEEEKNNFANAVKKVFSLQSSLYEIKEKLKKSMEENSDLLKIIEEKKETLDKLNIIAQTRSDELKIQKDLNRKLELKCEELNKEIMAMKESLKKQYSQNLELIKNIQDKDATISSLKSQLFRIGELENEILKVKQEKLKLTGIIKKDQFDFNEKIIEYLNKISKDIKIIQLKIPTISKTLIPLEKNFLNIINLMKSWQDYIDEAPLEKEIVNARQFFENFFNPWSKVFIRKKITFIKNNIIPDTLKIKINQEKIKTALYQLIKNEYEYLSQGSTLKVLIKKDEQAKNVIIEMEDTSQGLMPEVLNKLFLPFNTTKKDHAGIGFAIANRIFSLHDGSLKVYNKEKQGLIIEISLPIND